MSGSSGPRRLRGSALRALLRHRRTLAAALAAGSVAAGVSVLSPAGPATAAVLTAARDLPWGASLTASDLRRVALPVDAVPDGAVLDEADVRGRLLAGPMRRGEPITDVRLVGPGLLAASAEEGAGLVATPVRIADPEAAALLRAGDTVDVLAAAEGPDDALVVASAVRVLAVPRALDDAGGALLAEGALVVLATEPAVAARLARAATTSRLSIVLRPG